MMFLKSKRQKPKGAPTQPRLPRVHNGPAPYLTASTCKYRCFVVLSEFSEIYGPVPLKTIPNNLEASIKNEIENFVVRVMTVDFSGTHAGVPTFSPEDTTMLYENTSSGLSAFVYYFNLHDIEARGYSRFFALSFITVNPGILSLNIDAITSCFKGIAKVCHLENMPSFNDEMLNFKLSVTADATERVQIHWWLNAIARSSYISSMSSRLHGRPSNSYSLASKAKDDMNLSYQHATEEVRQRSSTNSRSLPYLLDSNIFSECPKHIESHNETPKKFRPLRSLVDLIPIAYCFLDRSMIKLQKSYGKVDGLRAGSDRGTPSLAIGRHMLQFPGPNFYPTVEKMKVQPMGELQIDDNFDVSQKSAECKPLLWTKLDYALNHSDPFFIDRFCASTKAQWNPKKSVNCCYPKRIAFDLLLFRRVLKKHCQDFVFSVLSGRPVVIVGGETEEMSCSFKNALSLFVTIPQRVCPFIIRKLNLEKLGTFTLIQCENSARNLKIVECFARSGLCSFINHDKRAGRAPKYKGTLVTRILGDERITLKLSGETLFELVQSGLVSELGFELIEKYYTLMLNKDCAIEEVYGTKLGEEFDNMIYKFQTLLLIDPDATLLSSSHSPSFEFQYEFYDTATKFPVRLTS